MSPKKHFILILTITLLSASLVFFKSFFKRDRYRTDGPEMTVVCGGALTDDAAMPLSVGEKVRMLGYVGHGRSLRYLVETEGGFRGYVRPWVVDLPVFASYHNGLNGYIADTITNLTGETEVHYGYRSAKIITGHLKDGKEVHADFKELKPVFEKSSDFRLSEGLGASRYVSREKFEKEIMGRSFAYVEEMFSPSTYILPADDGFISEQRIGVFDPETGGYSYPQIFYGPDSLAMRVSYIDYFDSSRAKIAKHIPFMAFMTDLPLTSFAARDSLYDPEVDHWWQRLLLTLLDWGLTMLWVFLPVFIPAYVLAMLMFVPLMRFIPNNVVTGLVVCVTVVAGYYWTAVLVPYQAWWWVIAIVALVNLASFMFAINIVVGAEGHHRRCPQCRHMFTITERSRKLLDRYTEKKIAKDSYRTTRRDLRQTESTITTGIDQSGNVYSHVDETRTYDVTKERDVFEETWLVTVERVFRQCDVCGFKEDRVEKSKERVKREYIGTDVKYDTDVS